MLVRVSPSLLLFNRQPFEEVEGGGGSTRRRIARSIHTRCEREAFRSDLCSPRWSTPPSQCCRLVMRTKRCADMVVQRLTNKSRIAQAEPHCYWHRLPKAYCPCL